LPDAGLTPDSPFYFLDGLFDSREEKIAEIMEMIREGKVDAARKALEKYKEHVRELEDDPDPRKRGEARRAVAMINRALRDLERDLDEDIRREFVDSIRGDERGVVTALEISSKIRDLCEQLSELDPNEYNRVCGLSGDSKPWERELHKDLTEEQRKEAREFGEILSDCMRTSGGDCRCEDISFVAMQEMCITARPLAVACGLNDDEEACDKLDSLEFPEMPDYLRDVADRLDDKYADDNFDHHFPGACEDAGIDPRDGDAKEKCFAVMVDIEAPPECREAIKEAGANNEREAREVCEKIMFDLDAPQECLDEGIDNFKDCGEFMRSQGFDEKGGGPRGPDCGGIENSEERLKCYDSFDRGDFERGFRDDYKKDFDDHYDDYNRGREEFKELHPECVKNRIHWPPDCERFLKEELPGMRERRDKDFEGRSEGTREQQKQCEVGCRDQGKAWDFYGGECECYAADFGDNDKGGFGGYDCDAMYCQQGSHCEPDYGCASDNGGGSFDDRDYDDNYEESECKDGCGDECLGASRTDCVDGGMRCECYYDGDEYKDDGGSGGGGFDGGDGELGSSSPFEGDDSSGSGGDSGSSSSGGGDSGGSDGDSGDSSPINAEVVRGITGNSVGNKFLDYYFRR